MVGINTAVTQGANGIGFAIPLSEKIVSGIVDSVIRYSSIKRAFLGIRYTPVGKEVLEKEGIPALGGAMISGSENAPAVIPGSPADKAGIKSGDIITEADGKSLSLAV